MSIIAKGISYTYNPNTPFAKQALTDVNLTVNDGEFLGLIGHTGSGKSTFVQHLNGLIRLEKGELVVEGINLADKKPDLKKLRSFVGMVFQYPEYQLFADTVAKDVAFGPKNMRLPPEETDRRVKQALETVGLDYAAVADKSPFDLSGGERRRAALAGVLAMEPRVLILDEPTAGLDPMGKTEILSLMKKIRDQRGATVIMISHDMNEIYENADRVAVFVDGTIKHDMPPDELFALPDMEKLGLMQPAMAKVKSLLAQKGFEIKGRTVKEVFESITALRRRDV